MTEPVEFGDPLLEWCEDQPRSLRFNDIYFSRENGLAESRYVFLDQNRLGDRWRSLAVDPSAPSRFTIAETGFGTGLNFLCAVQAWLATAPASAQLHYLSVEKFPLSPDQLARATGHWPELDNLRQELQAVYPPRVPGFHRAWLFGERVCLTLIFADASKGLAAVLGSDHPAFANVGNPAVDAWFLDGFAPSQNPDLWTDELFALMARLSRAETTFATFTAAGCVNRGLQRAGFVVAKVPGFGQKREMLRGAYRPATTGDTRTPETAQGRMRSGHYNPPWYLPRNRATAGDNSATVIGAGIAGCCTARALAQRGWQVTLIDGEPDPASGASGNPQGIVYPKLSVEPSPLADFGLTALCHARNYYRELWQSAAFGERCGVLVLPEQAQEAIVFRRIADRYRGITELVHLLQGHDLSETAGIELASTLGLFFPGLGWLNPPAICNHLANHPNIRYLQAGIRQLTLDTPGNRWHLLNEREATVATASVVVIANSNCAAQFVQTAHLPLKPVRGQISALPASAESRKLKTAICGHGYLAPHQRGLHTLGATYNPGVSTLDVRPEDHALNFDGIARTDLKLAQLFAGAPHELPDFSGMEGRAALRCSTPDYLPIAGPAPRFRSFLHDFAPLQKNARADIPLAGDYWPGLYLSCGHGSRGLAYAPLAAELIAGQICGEVLPLPRYLAVAINPARFIVRNIKRKKPLSESGESPVQPVSRE